MTLSTRTCTNECAARTQHLNLIVLIFIINMRTYFIHIFFIVSFHFVWWLIARRSRSYINHVDFYICVLCSVVQWLMVGNDYEKRPTKLTRPLICSDILKFQQCPLAECHSIQPYSHCLVAKSIKEVDSVWAFISFTSTTVFGMRTNAE